MKIYFALLCGSMLILSGCSSSPQKSETLNYSKSKSYQALSGGHPTGWNNSCGPSIPGATCAAGLVCDPQTDTCLVPCTSALLQQTVGGKAEICNPVTGTFEPSCSSVYTCSSIVNTNVQTGTFTCTTGYCSLGCTSSADCNLSTVSSTNYDMLCSKASPANTCVPKVVNGACAANTELVASSEYCLWPVCNANSTANCPANSNLCTSGYCAPSSCTSGNLCLNNQPCMGGSCTACSAQNPCPSSNTKCDTQSSSPTYGQCVAQCSGATCASCNAAPNSCPAQFHCAANLCVANCINNQICPRGQACNIQTGVCGACDSTNSNCSTGQVCSAGACLTICEKTTDCLSGAFCISGACQNAYPGDGIPQSSSTSEVCDEGNLAQQCCGAQGCSDTACPQGFVCPVVIGNSASNQLCIPSTRCSQNSDCGQGSTCTGCSAAGTCTTKIGYCSLPTGPDAITSNISTGVACPTGSECTAPQTCSNGVCVLTTTTAMTGNGLNGHCATDGKSVCAIAVKLSGLPAIASPLRGAWASATLQTASSLQAAITAAGSTNATPTCPNGYGVWVSYGVDTNESYPLSLTKSMNIFGGFAGTEFSPADRVSAVGPLGRNGPSGTKLDAQSHNPILYLGDGSTSTTVLFDGFQLYNGVSGTTNTTCLKATPGIQASGAVTICGNATGILKNLRFFNNRTTSNGGAIRNEGILSVRNSTFWNNLADIQGGAISHDGTLGIVENSVFYGNQVPYQAAPPALCTAGSNGTGANSCPPGYICPIRGGACVAPKGITVNLPQGGAIASTASGSALTIEHDWFNTNQSWYDGGAVYLGKAATINNSQFTNNTASHAGGAVYLGDSANSSTLSYLTFIDNKAYNQGGGGIYDIGSSSASTISSAIFINNKGLYAINNTGALEWMGARAAASEFPVTQINSISDGVYYSTPTGSFANNSSSQTMSKTNVQMCPIMAYFYASGQQCDGSSLCGTTPGVGSLCNAGSGSNCLLDPSNLLSSLQDHYGNQNQCSMKLLTDCSFPTYRNCGYQALSQTSVAPSVTSSVQRRDIFSNLVSVSPKAVGAYGSGCQDVWDCPQSPAGRSCLEVTGEKKCLLCSRDSDCSGNPNGKYCVNNNCIFCLDSLTCPANNECIVDTDCLADGTYCLNHVCVACRTNADCPNDYHVCNASHICEQCATNADCPKGTSPSYEAPYCLSGNCVQCQNNADCSQVTYGNTCNSNNQCVCAGNNNQICANPEAPTCSQAFCTCGNVGSCLSGAQCVTGSGANAFACSCEFDNQPDATLCPIGQACTQTSAFTGTSFVCQSTQTCPGQPASGQFAIGCSCIQGSDCNSGYCNAVSNSPKTYTQCNLANGLQGCVCTATSQPPGGPCGVTGAICNGAAGSQCSSGSCTCSTVNQCPNGGVGYICFLGGCRPQ